MPAKNSSIIKSRNVCSFLFRCRHAVVTMQLLNWTNQCPLFMTVRHIFEISEDEHPRLVTHARDIWWTLDSANAFVSPGVNSRGELVPSARGLAEHRVQVCTLWELHVYYIHHAYTMSCARTISQFSSGAFYPPSISLHLKNQYQTVCILNLPNLVKFISNISNVIGDFSIT
jgi:hypothetical protein